MTLLDLYITWWEAFFDHFAGVRKKPENKAEIIKLDDYRRAKCNRK